jgi:hypothetical protein
MLKSPKDGAYYSVKEVTITMILQTILPALSLLAFAGFVLAGVLWGEDSALPSGMSRDGRAVRWSLRPTDKG